MVIWLKTLAFFNFKDFTRSWIFFTSLIYIVELCQSLQMIQHFASLVFCMILIIVLLFLSNAFFGLRVHHFVKLQICISINLMGISFLFVLSHFNLFTFGVIGILFVWISQVFFDLTITGFFKCFSNLKSSYLGTVLGGVCSIGCFAFLTSHRYQKIINFALLAFLNLITCCSLTSLKQKFLEISKKSKLFENKNKSVVEFEINYPKRIDSILYPPKNPLSNSPSQHQFTSLKEKMYFLNMNFEDKETENNNFLSIPSLYEIVPKIKDILISKLVLNLLNTFVMFTLMYQVSQFYVQKRQFSMLTVFGNKKVSLSLGLNIAYFSGFLISYLFNRILKIQNIYRWLSVNCFLCLFILYQIIFESFFSLRHQMILFLLIGFLYGIIDVNSNDLMTSNKIALQCQKELTYCIVAVVSLIGIFLSFYISMQMIKGFNDAYLQIDK